MPEPKVLTLDDKIKGIYEILNAKKAPAAVGQPIFAKDIEIAKACGGRTMAHLIGARSASGADDGRPMPFCLNFGLKSATFLMTPETRIRLLQFKKNFHMAELQAQIKSRDLYPSVDCIKSTPAWKDFVEPMCKAFAVADFAQWIPTVNSRFFFEEFEIPHVLRNIFDTVPMDSPTVNVPGALGLLEGQLEADDGTFTVQSNTEANFLVQSKNNVVHTEITEDLMQDSAPAIIEKLRREVVKGIARAEERALISGDITATHQDSDLDALPKTFAKAYNGLRKKSLAAGATHLVDHGNLTADKDLFANLLKKMKEFGSDKADLRYVYSPLISTELVTGAIPELFTAFAFGDNASNRTGVVPPVFGIQGIESSFMRDDTNAAGVFDGITTNRSTLILVKTSRFSNYLRQALRVWAAPSLPSSDKMLMTSKMRHSWNGNPQNVQEISVAYAHNVAQS